MSQNIQIIQSRSKGIQREFKVVHRITLKESVNEKHILSPKLLYFFQI